MDRRNIIGVALMLIFLFFVCSVKTLDESFDKYRLPDSVRPEHYKLTIFTHINDDEGFKYYGDVRITINILESTKNVTLHSKSLNISTGDVRISALSSKEEQRCYQNVSITRTEFQNERDFFIIHTNKLLEPGCQFELVIPFQSELNEHFVGYYRSSYINEQNNEKRYATYCTHLNTYAMNDSCFFFS